MNNGISSINNTINSLNATAVQYSNYLNGNLSSIVSFRDATNPAIEATEESLFDLQTNSTLTIAQIRIAMQLGLNDDTINRASLIATDATYSVVANQTINQTISIFAVQENSRAAVVAASFSAINDTAWNLAPNLLAMNLTAEISRETSVQRYIATTVVTRPAANPTGSSDDSIWFVDQQYHH